jgi:hypothetical protein
MGLPPLPAFLCSWARAGAGQVSPAAPGHSLTHCGSLYHEWGDKAISLEQGGSQRCALPLASLSFHGILRPGSGWCPRILHRT